MSNQPAAASFSDTSPKPVCRCGYDRENFWVSAQARYSFFGFVMGVFMGLSTTLPKSIRFKCRKCGQTVEERFDKKTIKAFREH